MKMDTIKNYDSKNITKTQNSVLHQESGLWVGNYGSFSGGNVSDAMCQEGSLGERVSQVREENGIKEGTERYRGQSSSVWPKYTTGDGSRDWWANLGFWVLS